MKKNLQTILCSMIKAYIKLVPVFIIFKTNFPDIKYSPQVILYVKNMARAFCKKIRAINTCPDCIRIKCRLTANNSLFNPLTFLMH